MKILIVDDEKLICEWLGYSIQSNNDWHIVGIAHNGEDALAMFKEMSPDIIITDLKMPVMDGIDLIKAIRQDNDWTQIIILSAFSDFDLVREALRLGANEYMLKTEMNKDNLQEALTKAKKAVLNTAKKDKLLSKDNSFNQVTFRRLLMKNRVLTESELAVLNMSPHSLSSQSFFAIAIWTQQLTEVFHLPQDYPVSHVTSFHYDNSIYVYLLKMTENFSKLATNDLINNYGSAIVAINHCPIAISHSVHHLTYIPISITRVVETLEKSFYLESNQVLQEKLNEKKQQVPEQPKMIDLQHTNPAVSLKMLLSYYDNHKILPIKTVKKNITQLLNDISATYANDDDLRDRLTKALPFVESAIFFSQLTLALEEIIAYLEQQELFKSRKSSYVADSITFIRQNYMKPISLEDTASSVGLSQEYFSKIFANEVGINYSTYLMKLRLNEAKKLLSHSAYKVQQVAEAVGYPNVSYFSTIFKKEFNISPFEFKRKQLP